MTGSKIFPIVGGCSGRGGTVGFQFVIPANGNDYYLEGSFNVSRDGTLGKGEPLEGRLFIGQSFSAKGCKRCKNRFVYQCGHCGGIVCYDGKAGMAVCPLCAKEAAVPATGADGQIVRSGAYRVPEILLAMDISASMDEPTGMGRTRLEETKEAAIGSFIRAFPAARMALVAFGSHVTTVHGFTTDRAAMENAVRSLSTDGGTTSPFRHIRENFTDFLSGDPAGKYIVVFTDGAWAGKSEGHINIAEGIRSSGVQIITIGCAGADLGFLSRIATDGADIRVVGTDFSAAYATAVQRIIQ